MAKMPTIRLRKTELPIDADTARTHSASSSKQIEQRTLDLVEEFHTVDGSRIPELTARFKNEFYANSFQVRIGGMRPTILFRTLAARRLADCESHFAPWIWKAKNSAATPTRFDDGKSEPETFFGTSETIPFRFEIPFESKGYDEAVSREKQVEIWQSFTTSKQNRALVRYIKRLNWECLKAAIPASLDYEFAATGGHTGSGIGWDGDRIFCPGVRVRVSFERTWIQGTQYGTRSLLSSAGLNSVPAEFDLEEAKLVLENKSKSTLRAYPLSLDAMFEVLGSSPTTAPTSAWTNELLFGTKPDPADVRNGKAPIPPEAEMVMVTTLLERIPEMKRILRTLMRIAKPYDNVSFLPTDL